MSKVAEALSPKDYNCEWDASKHHKKCPFHNYTDDEFDDDSEELANMYFIDSNYPEYEYDSPKEFTVRYSITKLEKSDRKYEMDERIVTGTAKFKSESLSELFNQIAEKYGLDCGISVITAPDGKKADLRDFKNNRGINYKRLGSVRANAVNGDLKFK